MPIQDCLYSVIFPQFTSLQLLSDFFCRVHLKPLLFAFLLRISNHQDKLQRAISSFVHRLGRSLNYPYRSTRSPSLVSPDSSMAWVYLPCLSPKISTLTQCG